jgi:hypothetical protein
MSQVNKLFWEGCHLWLWWMGRATQMLSSGFGKMNCLGQTLQMLLWVKRIWEGMSNCFLGTLAGPSVKGILFSCFLGPRVGERLLGHFLELLESICICQIVSWGHLGLCKATKLAPGARLFRLLGAATWLLYRNSGRLYLKTVLCSSSLNEEGHNMGLNFSSRET